jgi:hypothetical protein
MNVGTSFSSIKKSLLKGSPDSFRMDDSSPVQIQGGLMKKPTDFALIKKLRRTMETAMKNACYLDAIFFADKILALALPNTDQYIDAVYDLANALFLNKEYIRCVQLIGNLLYRFKDLIWRFRKTNWKYKSDLNKFKPVFWEV